MENDGLVQLILDMKESLERQIHAFRDAMTARFDRIETRLDRQGGLLRVGQTNLVHLNDWSEKVDQLLRHKANEAPPQTDKACSVAAPFAGS